MSARILVVDDVRANVRLLEAVLVPHGYEVIAATDGTTALRLVESAKPDLVLLDVMMPDMSGYAVCERLREHEETAVLPVIMITSSVGPEKTKAIEAGADDFIPKPFNHEELLTRVRSLLRIKRYHDTIKAQAAELAQLNGTLEQRVQVQVEELGRLRRLRRFLSPQLVEAVVSSGDESILRRHRREACPPEHRDATRETGTTEALPDGSSGKRRPPKHAPCKPICGEGSSATPQLHHA